MKLYCCGFMFSKDFSHVLLIEKARPKWQEGKVNGIGGHLESGESPVDAMVREFEEETGLRATGPFVPLEPVRQKGGKIVHAWAFEGDCDPSAAKSNTFSMEWPPRSGRQVEFPEIDRMEFFTLAEAEKRIKAGQGPLLDELGRLLKNRRSAAK